MNDLTKQAAYWLTTGDDSPFLIGTRLNEIPLSALKQGGSSYGFPRGVFEALVGSTNGDRSMPDA